MTQLAPLENRVASLRRQRLGRQFFVLTESSWQKLLRAL
jgi:hypothetical protein